MEPFIFVIIIAIFVAIILVWAIFFRKRDELRIDADLIESMFSEVPSPMLSEQERASFTTTDKAMMFGLGLYVNGQTEYDQGNKNEALGYLQKAAQFYQYAGYQGKEAAEVLILIGTIYYDQGQYDRASKTFQQALPLCHSAGKKKDEADALRLMGVIYYRQGEFSKALYSLQSALQIYRQIDEKSGEAATLISMAGPYSGQEENMKALDSLRQAKQLLHEVGDQTWDPMINDTIRQIQSA